MKLTKEDIKLLKEERRHLKEMIVQHYENAPLTKAMTQLRIRDIDVLLNQK